MWNVYGNLPFASPSFSGQQPQSPTQALDYYLPANASTGGGTFVMNLPNVREIYVGTWWATNPEFQGYMSGSNKLFFIYSDGDNNLISWLGLQDQARELNWINQSTYSNCHLNGYISEVCPGTGTFGKFANNVESAWVTAGSGWHRIEIYIKASTTASSKDGIYRFWLDGRLRANYSGVNFYPNGIQNVQYNSTWDGQPSAACPSPTGARDCSRSWHHYYDHLRISVPNCGASGCGVPVYLVITSTLPGGRTGTPYTATLSAEGGKQPYAWFLETGNLPPGLSLNQNTGVISGAPTCAGRSDFTIRVTDASTPALTVTKSYSIITSGTGTCTSGMEDSREWRVASRELENGIRVESRAGTVRFNLPINGSAQYRLSVYDLTGRKIYTHESMGQQEISITTPTKSGVYLAKFVQGKQSNTIRFNVLN